MNSRPAPFKDTRGSILVVTAMLATIMAVSIASFIKLGNHESRLANMSFYLNNSLNLAEGGVEQALYALNHDDWSGWSRENGVAIMTPIERHPGGNQTGVVQVRIEDYATRPVVLAQGETILPNRPPVTRQVRVELSRRSPFANGITARDGAKFKGGNSTVDSYRSSLGPPSAANRFDNGSVASVSVEVNAVDLSNATIYGYVATGASMPRVGPNGKIIGKNTPAGVDVDKSRVALDFASDFPEVDVPDHYDVWLGNVEGSGGTTTLGTVGATTPTVYLVDDIDLSGDSLLTIVGPVIIRVMDDVKVSGQAEIRVADTGSAVLFFDDDVSISGNGMVNATTVPANLLVYGSNPIYQSMHLGGNGALQAAVYAPNAHVQLVGNGSVAGAVVGDTVTLNGNVAFHYDEDLAKLEIDKSYRMDSWRELHLAADRVTF